MHCDTYRINIFAAYMHYIFIFEILIQPDARTGAPGPARRAGIIRYNI
jgi:hypothetical protein